MDLSDEGIYLYEWNPVLKKGLRMFPPSIEHPDNKLEEIELPNTYTVFKLRQSGMFGHHIQFVKEMQEHLANKAERKTADKAATTMRNDTDIKLIFVKF